MKRKLIIFLVLACLAALCALLAAGGRSDHDCIRLITGQELPQAKVVKSLRGERGLFAVFFELPPAEADALCRKLPAREGWQPLEPGRCFGICRDPERDVTGLSGSYAAIAGDWDGTLPFLLRLNDGRTLVAIMAGICM